MSITCLKAGTLATIQDIGRIGYQNIGVIVSGAMDSFALKIANRLLGNHQHEACIEVTMRGTAFHFSEDTYIAITGGDLTPTIQGMDVPQWRPVLVRANQTLRFKGAKKGLRSYLAVQHGFLIEEKLGSKSTYLRANMGGLNGRALQEQDEIQLMNTNWDTPVLPIKNEYFSTVSWHVRPDFYKKARKRHRIRFVEGYEYQWFTTATQQNFERVHFDVAMSSDRMGYRLKGFKLQKDVQQEMVSEAVTNGTIQVANDGQPIILLADRQTTGGYPRIGQVISADLHRFGQMKPGDQIRFERVTLDEAYEALYDLEQQLNHIEVSIQLKK